MSTLAKQRRSSFQSKSKAKKRNYHTLTTMYNEPSITNTNNLTHNPTILKKRKMMNDTEIRIYAKEININPSEILFGIQEEDGFRWLRPKSKINDENHIQRREYLEKYWPQSQALQELIQSSSSLSFISKFFLEQKTEEKEENAENVPPSNDQKSNEPSIDNTSDVKYERISFAKRRQMERVKKLKSTRRFSVPASVVLLHNKKERDEEKNDIEIQTKNIENEIEHENENENKIAVQKTRVDRKIIRVKKKKRIINKLPVSNDKLQKIHQRKIEKQEIQKRKKQILREMKIERYKKYYILQSLEKYEKNKEIPFLSSDIFNESVDGFSYDSIFYFDDERCPISRVFVKFEECMFDAYLKSIKNAYGIKNNMLSIEYQNNNVSENVSEKMKNDVYFIHPIIMLGICALEFSMQLKSDIIKNASFFPLMIENKHEMIENETEINKCVFYENQILKIDDEISEMQSEIENNRKIKNELKSKMFWDSFLNVSDIEFGDVLDDEIDDGSFVDVFCMKIDDYFNELYINLKEKELEQNIFGSFLNTMENNMRYFSDQLFEKSQFEPSSKMKAKIEEEIMIGGRLKTLEKILFDNQSSFVIFRNFTEAVHLKNEYYTKMDDSGNMRESDESSVMMDLDP